MPDWNSLFRLDGRVAFVAGAASGIGAASARGMAAVGATVICADIQMEGAERTASEIHAAGGNAEAIALDIGDEAAVHAAMNGARERYGRFDVLLSTPAVNVRKRLLDYRVEEVERVLRLNLRGNFIAAQTAARIMRDQGRGSIILMSSIRAVTVEPGQGVYASTKVGLIQLARGFAVELGGSGVRVNCLAPGVVETPLTAPIKAKPDWYNAYANRNALGRWASADEMVGPVIFLASDASSYVTGAVIFADAVWTAIDGRFEPPL